MELFNRIFKHRCLGFFQKNITEIKIGNGDLILIALCFVVGYINDNTGPKPYHYENQIVIVDKKYQCPTYCGLNHKHHVYFEGEKYQMVIDKSKLGKKVKEKKIKKKNKR